MDFSINNGEPAGEPFVKKKKGSKDLESNGGQFDYVAGP